MDKRERLEYYLEQFIDESGIGEIVCALAQICDEKAEHVRTNWQDEAIAKAWEKIGTDLWFFERRPKIKDAIKVISGK